MAGNSRWLASGGKWWRNEEGRDGKERKQRNMVQ